MAFKMKAGKEGPMKKNLGSAMKKPLVGNQKNLPDHLKKKILEAPTKAMKNDAPMMRMEKGAMKKMGSPKKIDANFRGARRAKKERDATAKREFLENYKKMTPEEQAKIPKPVKEAYGV